MKVALINPRWRFDGSIYFGCRAAHFPIEFGASRQLLEVAGHRVLMLDAHLFDLELSDVVAELQAYQPDMTVITTAPSYLFWRCAPPELRVPQEMARAIRETSPLLVAVGPHGSATPRTVLAKLGVDVVVMGECEETLVRLAGGEREITPGLCWRDGGRIQVNGGPQAAQFVEMAPLHWPRDWIVRHSHHHHRFEAAPIGPGAEVESSRGCPYTCTFCAKENYRNAYRRRRTDAVIAEIAHLQRQGVEYVYFIDEIFLPNLQLLGELVGRGLKFGVQTRIDLWKPEQLELLGRAGCVSIEAGIESLREQGRATLAKKCRLSTEELTSRLVAARRHVPFVQANLIAMADDDAGTVERWRDAMRAVGIWANDPVPLFPYPGSPDYRRLWGEPDEAAWERAHAHYLAQFAAFSDLQEAQPTPLHELELECC